MNPLQTRLQEKFPLANRADFRHPPLNDFPGTIRYETDNRSL
jgi:hypothetical protein